MNNYGGSSWRAFVADGSVVCAIIREGVDFGYRDFRVTARCQYGEFSRTVSCKSDNPRAEKFYAENYELVKHMRTKWRGDCTFAFCVKWLALAYPGEVEQRISETFGPYTWQLAYPYYLETVMALLPINLPAYVVLWILDWLDKFRVAPEIRKVQFVEALRQSRRAILARRETRLVEQRTN